MTLSPAAETGLIVGIIVVGIALDQVGGVARMRNRLGSRQRWAVVILAAAVWYGLFLGFFATLPIDGMLVAVALSAALWLGLPVLFVRGLGWGATSPAPTSGVGAHYRATSTAMEPGVYRVVGSSHEVALLRLTDGDGNRIHTGDVIRVPEEVLESSFEPASNPDK